MEVHRPTTRSTWLGSATGTFLVLVAIATLVGQPWVYVESGIAAGAQILAALLTFLIGAGLLYLSLAE
ncbi:MAG: hypothetical protein ABEJ57_08650 [Halobacteriaceae archaeon]